MIPSQYQELEAVCNEIDNLKARCICFISLTGSEGSTSLCTSVATRLCNQSKKVLIIDLNPISPFKLDQNQSTDVGPWCFSDISCQLNIISTDHVDILTMQHLNEIRQTNPKIAVRMANENKAIKNWISNNFKSTQTILTIPVVVHVIHDMGNENISDESIQGALDFFWSEWVLA